LCLVRELPGSILGLEADYRDIIRVLFSIQFRKIVVLYLKIVVLYLKIVVLYLKIVVLYLKIANDHLFPHSNIFLINSPHLSLVMAVG